MSDIQKIEKRCDCCGKEPEKKEISQAGIKVSVYDIEECPLCGKRDVCGKCRVAAVPGEDKNVHICYPCLRLLKEMLYSRC